MKPARLRFSRLRRHDLPDPAGPRGVSVAPTEPESAPPMPRLFVAVGLPDVMKDTILRLRDAELGVRWTPRDQLHLTLRFIGQVDEQQTQRIVGSLGEVAAPSFLLSSPHLHVFPNLRKPRIIHAVIQEDGKLTRLVADLTRALRTAGVEDDVRTFRPHVTLARVKDASPDEVHAFLDRCGDLDLDPFTVQAFHLYESTLHRDGAQHHRLATYPLQFRG
jgi:RNA 2',3'-cyclic 3'-phosphodiesterase